LASALAGRSGGSAEGLRVNIGSPVS
jgi:hypothetical protein